MLVKLEFYNPASSVKDRLGIAIVDAAEASGELQPGGTIVEATSGNTGIALAMVGAARGYRVVLAMPSSMSIERRLLLKGYGAELVLTDPARGMKGAVAKAVEIRRDPRRRTRPPVRERGEPRDPPQDHRRRDPARHRRPDRLLRRRHRHGRHHHRRRSGAQGARAGGQGHRRRARRLAAADEGNPRPPQDPGHRTELRPRDPRPVRHRRGHRRRVRRRESTRPARSGTKDGILVGISSGAAVWAALQIAARPEAAGKNIVVIIPSFGERYLSTPLFEDLRED